MNKEDYVSLEVAKLLKEKGFNEPCTHFYCKMHDCIEDTLSNSCRFKEVTYKQLEGGDFLLPTLYDAQKWLREEHLLYVDVQAYYISYEVDENDYRDQERLWEYSIWEDTTYEVYEKVKSKCSYDTYEKALNAGILEALKLI